MSCSYTAILDQLLSH